MFTSTVNYSVLEKSIHSLLDSQEFKKENNPWLIFLKNKNIRTIYTNYAVSLDKTIFTLLHYNQFQIIDYLLKNTPQFLLYLKKLNPSMYGANPLIYQSEDVFFHAITRNAVETIDVLIKAGWEYKFAHLKAAVESNSIKSALYFLDKIQKQKIKIST